MSVFQIVVIFIKSVVGEYIYGGGFCGLIFFGDVCRIGLWTNVFFGWRVLFVFGDDL